MRRLPDPNANPNPHSQVTLRRLSEALRSTDLEELAQSSQMDLGLGLGALDGSTAETISASLEVRPSTREPIKSRGNLAGVRSISVSVKVFAAVLKRISAILEISTEVPEPISASSRHCGKS